MASQFWFRPDPRCGSLLCNWTEIDDLACLFLCLWCYSFSVCTPDVSFSHSCYVVFPFPKSVACPANAYASFQDRHWIFWMKTRFACFVLGLLPYVTTWKTVEIQQKRRRCQGEQITASGCQFPDTQSSEVRKKTLFLSHPSFKNLSLSSLSSNSWLWEFTLYHDLQKTIISSLSTKYNVFSLLSVVVTEWTQATLLFLFHLQSPSHPASHLIIQIFCQHSSVLTLASLSPVW